MPVVQIPIAETDTAMQRNIYKDVVDKILKETRYSQSAEVEFNESFGSVKNRMSYKNRKEKHLRTQNSDVVFVDVVEQYDEVRLMEKLREGNRSAPLIEDPKLGFSVTTSYMPVVTTLNIKFRFQSKTELNTFSKQLAIKEKLTPLRYEFNVHYDYPLSFSIIHFVKHMYELRENQAGYNDTITDYTKSIVKAPYEQRSNETGSFSILTFKEAQKGIEGYFDSEMVYNEKESQEGIHILDVSFVYKYERPSGFIVHFPVIVHNQLIDKQYFEKWFNIPDTKESKNQDVLESRIIRDTTRRKHYMENDYNRAFEYTDWLPQYPYPSMKTYLTIPICVDPNNLKAVFNLNDYAPKFIPAPVLSYITKFKDDISTYLANPYMLEIFSVNSNIRDFEEEQRYSYSIDNDGNITTTLDMELRERYFLRLSYLTDLTVLDSAKTELLLADYEDMFNGMYLVAGSLEVTDSKSVYKEKTRNGQPILEANTNTRIVTTESYKSTLKNIPTTHETFKSFGFNSARLVMINNIFAK